MESLHILLRFRQHLLDAFLVAGGHTAHTFHDGVGGGTLLVVGVVAILAAEVVIVAVVGEGTVGTGVEAGATSVADIRGDVGIAVVATHPRVKGSASPTANISTALAVGQRFLGRRPGRAFSLSGPTSAMPKRSQSSSSTSFSSRSVSAWSCVHGWG